MNFSSARWHPFVLLGLCAVLYFPYLTGIPFFNKGEPREALVVQSIVTEGEWLFPLRSGGEIPSKPPVFHWLGALFSLARGKVTEATVRFPSALLAALGVLCLYGLGKRLFGPNVALLGGIILITTFVYQKQAVEARVDMSLTFFVVAALTAFYALYQGWLSDSRWMYVFYLLLGAGVLAKGPVSLILVGMTILAFLGLRKRWDFLSRLCFHKGVFLMLAVGFSWYALALLRGGEDFFDRQVVHENLARFFIYGQGGTGHQKPLYYYLPYLFSQGFPWTLFLPFVAADWLRKRSLSEEATLFLVLWAVVIFGFFSLAAGKRPVYLLPLYPALSLLTARWFYEAEPAGKIGGIGLRLLGSLCFFVGAALAMSFFHLLRGGGLSDLFSILSPLLGPGDEAKLRSMQAMLGPQSRTFLLLLGASGLLWLVLAWDLLRTRLGRAPQVLALIALSGWLVAHTTFVPAMAQARSYGPFMEEVNRRVPEGQLYVFSGGFDRAPLIFYRGGPIPLLEGDVSLLAKRLKSTTGYVIMSREEWLKIQGDAPAAAPVLTSVGTGPDGDAPLVLVRGGS